MKKTLFPVLIALLACGFFFSCSGEVQVPQEPSRSILEPLCFKKTGNNVTVKYSGGSEMSSTGLEFSKDGNNYYDLTNNTGLELTDDNPVLFVRSKNTTKTLSKGVNIGELGSFSSEGDEGSTLSVSGNIMSLISQTMSDSEQQTLEEGQGFQGLFSDMSALTDASNLILPATTLSESCYQDMFSGCDNLEQAPVLPAEELTDGCYNGMFSGCENLSGLTVNFEEADSSCLQDWLPTNTNGNFTFTAPDSLIESMEEDPSLKAALPATTELQAASEAIEVTEVKLDKSSIELKVGKSASLTATIAPENATIKTLTWSSDNTSVAIVSSGLVTAKAEGKATITATAADGSGATAVCDVTVTKDTQIIQVTSITVSKEALTIDVGNSEVISAKVSPTDASNDAVNWSSDTPTVATVDENSGKITAKAEGTAIITATAADGSGVTGSCTVTVKKVDVTGITLNKTKMTLQVSAEGDLSVAAVTPENATDKTVSWSSDNIGVATVNQSGKVTAVASGTATITATANDGSGVTASCEVNVCAAVIKVSGITLQDKLTLAPEGTLTLNATVTPANATDKSLTWSSSDTEVVTIDQSGNVEAIAVGTAVITATANDESGVTATCTIKVEPVKVSEIILDHTSATIFKGESTTITAIVTPTDAADKNIIWSSSDESVATVKNGVVSAVDDGTATITATAHDGSGVTATCEITVNIKVAGILLNKDTLSLAPGGTETLNATVTPTDATDKTVTWSSSDESVATVSATGVVTAVADGTANIKATANDGSGVAATCVVTVQTPVVQVTGITLSQNTLNLVSGKTGTLNATVAPENATDKTVTWSSSDESVATVSATGVVTAVANGTASITATAHDGSGVTASCTVTVTTKVSEIMLSQKELSLEPGETETLNATVTPTDATDKTVTWSSSDESVATVADGVITAVAKGTATITATANDGSGVTASCSVSVITKVSEIMLSKTALTLVPSTTETLTVIVTPTDATDKTVTWSSGNTAVATVDQTGKITAVASGTATITATANDKSGVAASCTVTVVNPLCFTARENTTVSMELAGGSLLYLSYSTDGSTWKDFLNANKASSVAIAKGEHVYIKAGIESQPKKTNSTIYGWIFTSTGLVDVSGDILSLLNQDVSKAGLSKNCFYKIFGDNKAKIVECSINLPKTTAESCYSSMFSGCTSLTKAPELPATTLAPSCYRYMFKGCTSLTSTPELPATTLAKNCYSNMFSDCTGLTSVTDLDASELADYCYFEMFAGCTGLTSVQAKLPATTLTQSCYYSMFSGCTSLTKAPELSATTLAKSCCYCMFDGCSSLKVAESTGDEDKKIFTCPSTITTMDVYWMFKGTVNSLSNEGVREGYTYYWYL